VSRPRLLIALVVAAAAGYAVVRARSMVARRRVRPWARHRRPRRPRSRDRRPFSGGAVAAASNYLQLLDEASPTADASLRAARCRR